MELRQTGVLWYKSCTSICYYYEKEGKLSPEDYSDLRHMHNTMQMCEYIGVQSYTAKPILLSRLRLKLQLLAECWRKVF